MSHSNGTSTIEPGWYPDPAGSPFERWWDGVDWTQHLQQAGADGDPGGRVVGRHTPVYTVFIWLFTLLPLISSAALLSFHVDPMVPNDARSRLSYLGSVFLLWAGLQLLISVALLVFAYHDRRTLEKKGIASPFHWAWTFLSSAVYVIGRSVVVKRRVGRGLLPIWVYLAVVAIAATVGAIKGPELSATLLTLLPTN